MTLMHLMRPGQFVDTLPWLWFVRCLLVIISLRSCYALGNIREVTECAFWSLLSGRTSMPTPPTYSLGGEPDPLAKVPSTHFSTVTL